MKNITTIEELRQYLTEPDELRLARDGYIREAAKSIVETLESVFEEWPEETLSTLLVDVGMILGTRRGIDGVVHLHSALEIFRQMLAYREEQRRQMN